VRRRSDLVDLAGRLFDLLVGAPDGMDIHEVTAALGVPQRQAEKVLNCLRRILGQDDTINVVWQMVGRRYVYQLSGNVNEGAQWQAYRMATKLSQLDVDLAYWRSVVRGCDGRTREGRMARVCLKHFERVTEDLREILETP
jgi:hypothetical protein